MATNEELATLVKRGLNLCAQGRRLDDRMSKEIVSGCCMTQELWAVEHYEKALAEWEEDAARALGMKLTKG